MGKVKDINRKIIELPGLWDQRFAIREILFCLVALSCFLSVISAPIALLMGLVFANFIGNPFPALSQKLADYSLQLAVVGLGFGIQAKEAFSVGQQSFWLTVFSISATLLLGWGLGKLLKIDPKTAFLVATGTAICGGSAIAAVSPVIKAKQHQISMALGAVFVLNSIALFIFPLIGQWLGMSAEEFGTWCAIAIHDTSSVVGAASQYGEKALQIATTVKLARALWIIPLAVLIALLGGKGQGKIKIPYFIGLFVVAVIANSYLAIDRYSEGLSALAQALMTFALFVIGCGLSRKLLFAGGLKTLAQASVLWMVIAGAILWLVVKWV
ncbi:putative sulfate exporter family transporter [Echinicola sediminis]